MRHMAALALIALAACGGSTEPKPAPWYDGTWSGTTGGQTITLDMIENGGAVTGTGTITGTPTRALTVAGTYSAPTLVVTLTAGLAPAVSLRGTVNGATMAATLTGSGFTGEGITMTRTK
jgi:hypothetical protein